ncbi:nitrous oxide reductase accessory protein NosL [uncultured Pontibacter sp.]|uniref:nitrous oxide reductase accessory protein NosL n=1 Tax=uncultured Pontibacter sp. TaxID=453356 RepID=UPI0026050F56|nr:nitrous oxide reductase accessory protein NosL [uncultured Pontibacter sp.]
MLHKTTLYTLSLLLLLIGAAGCSVEPKPVPYGEANCVHCQMTVSDNRYGAELVNDKGKAFFFDSAECLAAYALEQPELSDAAAYLLVTDFTNPDNLVEVDKAHFLQSRELPSPMGMYLTAVADEATASRLQQEYGGRLLNWEGAKDAVRNNEKPE